MEFGRLPESQLNKIDFSLPAEPAFNKTVLSGKKSPDSKVFVGCAKWGRPEWVGKIYPKGTKEKDFLSYYVDCYNSIELNATNYRMPSGQQIKNWQKLADGKDFIFCPKLTRFILPSDDIEKEKTYLDEFTKAVENFGKNLGPLFLLLSDNFSPAKNEMLLKFLEIFPASHQLFIELRNQEWYADKDIFKELLNDLSAHKTGLIITDTEGRRDMAHMNLTIPKAFIRFVGNSLHKTDYERCDDWVKRIDHWLKNGIEEIYFFMHMHDEATSPELTVYLIEQLNKICKLNLHNPDWQKK
jgi:uncharacterized protein YecE (DUF72 family)